MASVSGPNNAPVVTTVYNNQNPSQTPIPPNNTGNPNAVLLITGVTSGPATDLSDTQVALNAMAAAATAAGFAGLVVQSADGLAISMLGNDVVNLLGPPVGAAPLPTVTVQGGVAGSETIIGGSNPILILGGGGAESLVGGQAASTIQGGMGPDTIIGGPSTNVIYAGQAADFIFATTSFGKATVFGGAGDTIFGGVGASTIYGGAGDTIQSGTGIPGAAGQGNVVYGASGDVIVGGSGSDTIYGASGDTIFGGNFGGAETIHAEAGGIFVIGSSTPTTAGGVAGPNLIIGGAHDTIQGGTGTAVIDGRSGGGQLIVAGPGNQTLAGGAGDTLFGGAGNDVIDASPGAELIVGTTGAYTIQGGIGDTIAAGVKTNVINLGNGPEKVWEGESGIAGAGASTVSNFSEAAGDRIVFQGENGTTINSVLAGAKVVGGNTVLTLPDGSTITLVGVTKIDAGIFGTTTS